jgi:hypothetical protein
MMKPYIWVVETKTVRERTWWAVEMSFIRSNAFSARNALRKRWPFRMYRVTKYVPDQPTAKKSRAVDKFLMGPLRIGKIDPPSEHDSWLDSGGYRIDSETEEQVCYVWNSSQRCPADGGPQSQGPEFGTALGKAYAECLTDAPAAALVLALICAGKASVTLFPSRKPEVIQFQLSGDHTIYYIDNGDGEKISSYTDLINAVGWDRCRAALEGGSA